MKNKTMQQAIFWMVIAFGIFLIIDIYTFQAIKLAFGNHTWINVVYWLITLFVLGYMIYSTQSYDRASAPQKIINNTLFAFFGNTINHLANPKVRVNNKTQVIKSHPKTRYNRIGCIKCILR